MPSAVRTGLPAAVSILTRPGGRVQRGSTASVGNHRGFQSSPVPEDGCNFTNGEIATHHYVVSILTRPGGRVQPDVWYIMEMLAQVSILTRPGGRVQPRRDVCLRRWSLVSILTRPEGRVQLPAASPVALARSFQSSPVPKDGCNLQCPSRRFAAILFQSSPVPKDGCNDWALAPEGCVFAVSILTRPEGRVQRAHRFTFGENDASFNPHPSRRTGATHCPNA